MPVPVTTDERSDIKTKIIFRHPSMYPISIYWTGRNLRYHFFYWFFVWSEAPQLSTVYNDDVYICACAAIAIKGRENGKNAFEKRKKKPMSVMVSFEFSNVWANTPVIASKKLLSIFQQLIEIKTMRLRIKMHRLFRLMCVLPHLDRMC